MAPLHMCILLQLVSTSVPGAKINLQADRLSLQYRSRLSQGLARFGFWTSKRKMSLSGFAADPERANVFLIDYIQIMFDHGRPFGLAKETILRSYANGVQTSEGAAARGLGQRLFLASSETGPQPSTHAVRNYFRTVPLRMPGCGPARPRQSPCSGSLGSRPFKPGSGACFAQKSFSVFTVLASGFLGVSACRIRTLRSSQCLNLRTELSWDVSV